MQEKIELFKRKISENNLDCRNFCEWLTQSLVENTDVDVTQLSEEEMIIMNIKYEEEHSFSDFDESYSIEFFGHYAPLFEGKETNELYFQ
jgi:hypothetical protein